jgi:tetratricopeptide (TPR) repeat protein
VPRFEDKYRNALSTQDASAVAVIDDFIATYVEYRGGYPDILNAVARYPDEPLVNAYAALLWLFLESPEGPLRARPYVERASAKRGEATAREKLLVDYVAAWTDGAAARREAIGERAVKDFPTDIVMVKAHQYHQFNRGDAPGMLRTAHRALAAIPRDPHVLSMAAFAYEQCHLLAEAEAAARNALDIMPSEPWGQHALAHVMLTQGRIAEGRDFLESGADGWSVHNSFMSTHLWWHLALFMLSEGETDAVLSAYDRYVWGIDKSYSQDQAGAISLLVRLEIASIDVGARWRDVADHVAKRGPDATEPFLTAHYVLCLAKDGRSAQADAMMGAIAERAETEMTEGVWRTVAAPLAEAMREYARGRHAQARALLSPIAPRLREVGGSHAQRDLFDLILLDATRRDDRLVEAQQMWELRRVFDPAGVPVNLALADIYAQLELPGEAAVARDRAERTMVEARRRRAGLERWRP